MLGAGGFLGRAIRRAWEDDPGRAELTLHFRQPPRDVDAGGDGFEWRALDLQRASTAECATMLDALAPDVVVNAVGLTAGAAGELRDTNVGVVTKLIDALDGRTSVHLIQLGSAAEYGTQREGRGVAEDAFATPLSAYGVTKFEATRRLLEAAADRRLTVTVLRVFNPVGRGSSPDTLPGRAARQLAAAAACGAGTVAFGPLDTSRDYVDARDVARAVLAAAAAPRRGSRLLNVGRGEAVSSREVVMALARLVGYDGDIVESADGSSRSARLRWQCADITAIGHALGWAPKYGLEEALADLCDGVAGDGARLVA